jgi:hypothetical protein
MAHFLSFSSVRTLEPITAFLLSFLTNHCQPTRSCTKQAHVTNAKPLLLNTCWNGSQRYHSTQGVQTTGHKCTLHIWSLVTLLGPGSREGCPQTSQKMLRRTDTNTFTADHVEMNVHVSTYYNELWVPIQNEFLLDFWRGSKDGEWAHRKVSTCSEQHITAIRGASNGVRIRRPKIVHGHCAQYTDP